MTSREIAAEMIVQRGLAATPKLLNLMTRRVAVCLRDKRKLGLVENAPTRGGPFLAIFYRLPSFQHSPASPSNVATVNRSRA